MSQSFSNNTAQSSFGLAPNVAALITYLFVPVTSIIFLVTEKQNRFVRFHAFQSLFYGIGLTLFSIFLTIVFTVVNLVVASISEAAGLLVSLVSLVFWLALTAVILIFWVVCLVKAWRGAMYKLPVVGNFAEKMIDG